MVRRLATELSVYVLVLPGIRFAGFCRCPHFCTPKYLAATGRRWTSSSHSLHASKSTLLETAEKIKRMSVEFLLTRSDTALYLFDYNNRVGPGLTVAGTANSRGRSQHNWPTSSREYRRIIDCLRRYHQDDAVGGIEESRDSVQTADLFDARFIKAREGSHPQPRP